jgi:hypothetical protein
MKQRYLILVCLVLWASASSAQIDPSANGIGIYADLDGLTNEVDVEVGKPLEAYLLLTRPSGAGGLGAWECNVVVPDNVKIWGWSFPAPGTICVSTPPLFCVGSYPYVVFENTTLLATFILTPLDCSPAQFYIEEFPNTQGVTKPRYIDCRSSGDTWMVDMNPYPSSDMAAAFTVNPSALPVTTKSWGDLKALYR